MKFIAILAAVVMAVNAYDSSLDNVWTAWRAQHSKFYATEAEETMRRGIFESNVQLITKHNFEADLGIHTYYLGLNRLADYTNEEYMGLLGYKGRKSSGSTYFPPSNVNGLADTVDWRTKGYVTPVKDQGQCGSCWAFSATGALEGQNFKKKGQLQSYSEQQLVDCSRAYGNEGCNGGWMDDGFKYVADMTKNGSFLDIESCYAYHARDQTCQFNSAASCKGGEATGFTDIKKNDETELTNAIATVGPISVAIDAAHGSFQLYKSGVYNEPRCSSTNLDHGVLAVGYGNDATGGDYYIVKNSWGTSWGNRGYIQMSRNKNNQCGIAAAASYPNV